MLATLIIVFREVFEAALVVGIATVAAHEAQIKHYWIYGGVFFGLMAAVVIALFADLIASSMMGMGQELVNALILMLASLLMAWTAIWMGKQGREVAGHIRQACKGAANKFVLAAIVALAIVREGAEVVLFLYAIAVTGENNVLEMLSGGVVGVLLALAVVLVLYRSMLRIPVKNIFLVVTCLIVLLSAGMASQSVSWLVMIDKLPALGQPIWNTSSMISEQGILGQLLHALMGYDERPSGIQVLTFVSVLSLITLFIFMQKRNVARPISVIASVMFVSLMISWPATDVQAKKVYSPIVEQGEREFEYLLDYSLSNDPAKNGSSRHQFELEYGVTDRWMTAIYGDFRKKPSQDFTYQGFKLENIYQLFEQGERWLDTGLYLEYIIPAHSLNKADVAEFKLLLEKESHGLVHSSNLILKKELGAKSSKGVVAGYAWQSRWRMNRRIEPAIEIYGSLGKLGNMPSFSRQSHQMGLVFLGQLPSRISYEAGYLFGLTSASNKGAFKLVLAYEML